eukprot:2332107-Amphidinium_carterae.2
MNARRLESASQPISGSALHAHFNACRKVGIRWGSLTTVSQPSALLRTLSGREQEVTLRAASLPA